MWLVEIGEGPSQLGHPHGLLRRQPDVIARSGAIPAKPDKKAEGDCNRQSGRTTEHELRL